MIQGGCAHVIEYELLGSVQYDLNGSAVDKGECTLVTALIRLPLYMHPCSKPVMHAIPY